MSTESRINPADNWFVGENKTFRYKMTTAGVPTVVGWGVQWRLYNEKTGALLLTKTPTNPDALTMDITVTAADSITLGPGTYNYVLQRIDPGIEQVLAFGTGILKSAVTQ